MQTTKRPLPFLSVVFSLLLFAASASASTMPLVGNDSVAPGQDSNHRGMAEAFSYTATTSGSTSGAHVYVDSGNTATTLEVGVYTDSSGQPELMLSHGSLSSPVAGAWNDVPLSRTNLTHGTTYWIALLGTGGTLNFRDENGGTSITTPHPKLKSLPSSYPVGRSWSTQNASVYINGNASSRPPPPPAAPSNTTAPGISGQAQQGEALTANDGHWNGTAPIWFKYQWQQDGNDISGATNAVYTVQNTDVGHMVDVVVTAWNGGGSASATSAPVGPVSAAPPRGSCPVSSGSTGPDGKNAPGSPDPWGGCWPGPGNTGVPARTTLTNVPSEATSGPGWYWNANSQGIFVTRCGVTLDTLNVAGSLFIQQGNGTRSASTPCVRITRSKIVGYVDLAGACQVADCGPLVMTDDEIDTADMPTYQSNGYTIQVNRANVAYDNFYEWRVNNHGGNGPDHCDGNCEIHDSWEHGLVVQSDFHMNAVGSNGTGPGNKLTVIHDYMSCGWDQAAILPPVTDSLSGAGCTSDLAMLPDFNTVTLDAEKNYFAPSHSYFDTSNPYRWFQPSDCLYPGQGTLKPYPTINDYIASNVWARGPSGTCGTDAYGSGTDTSVYGWGNGDVHQYGTDSGNVWGPGNMYDDGNPINQGG